MSLLRPLASLTGSLLARSGNATVAGWTVPPAAPPPVSLGSRPWDGLRLAEKGKARPSIMTHDGETESPFDAEMRISFRIDAERHHKLRVAMVREGRSRQQLLLAALDAYLADDTGSPSAGRS